MRQNLTNVKEVNIEDVEHFYVVGSTTKDGLIEGKSNVKLDLKKAASGGGGTSSEDAEKMYEALFGQMPYLQVRSEEEVVMVPLYEAFTTNIGTETGGVLYYKSSTPVPKATLMETKNGVTTIIFPLSRGLYMMELPAEEAGMLDTWYMPVAYDINLIDYTIPTSDNPTTVSGTLPDKQGIEVLVSDQLEFGVNPTEVYHWDRNKDAFIHDISDSTYYQLKQSGDNTIVWSCQHKV